MNTGNMRRGGVGGVCGGNGATTIDNTTTSRPWPRPINNTVRGTGERSAKEV